jgi:arginyl-tRNA synthetase
MKVSQLKQIIKEEILAEAKKDKTGLSFAIAANLEKYGKPQTPKDTKSTHFTKKQEKSVKKTAEKLKKSIKEDVNSYMFFENLKIIKTAVDEMLQMNEATVDQILSDGHNWAEDHIATSKDDVEEVYNFLKNKQTINEKLKGKQVKLDANKNGKIDAEDFKLLKAKKK